MAADEPRQWLTLPVGQVDKYIYRERDGGVRRRDGGEMVIYTNAVGARPRARVVGDVTGKKPLRSRLLLCYLRRKRGVTTTVAVCSRPAREKRRVVVCRVAHAFVADAHATLWSIRLSGCLRRRYADDLRFRRSLSWPQHALSASDVDVVRSTLYTCV